MTLIDKDELLTHKCDCYDTSGHLLYAVPTGYIVAAKPVDALPVHHAQWIKLSAKEWPWTHECSECGKWTDDATPYCPRCGCEMGDNNEL